MITTGSKFYYGLAGVGILAAVLYGIITNGIDHGGVLTMISSDGAVSGLVGPLTLGYKGGVGDHVGYTLLMGFGLSALGLGIMCSFFRDGAAEAIPALVDGEAGVASPTPIADSASVWPLGAGVGATLMTLGLATGPVLFVVGVIVVTISAVMWTVEAWAARATGDAKVNREIRNRFIRPFEIPIASVLLAALVVFSISRLLLAVSKNGSWIAALVLGALFFITAIVLSTRPTARRSVVATILILGFVLIIGVGIYGAVKGERFHEETPAGQTGGEHGG